MLRIIAGLLALGAVYSIVVVFIRKYKKWGAWDRDPKNSNQSLQDDVDEMMEVTINPFLWAIGLLTASVLMILLSDMI